MAVFRAEPYSGMNFLVDLGVGADGGPESGVLEVVFPEARIQTVEYRSGNDPDNEPTKISTAVRYGSLILRRGANGSLNWYQWWNAVRNGERPGTRNILVRLLTEDRADSVLTWRFWRARPTNHQFAPLNALSSTTLIETLEIDFERLEME